jgi:glutamine amidotransferase
MSRDERSAPHEKGSALLETWLQGRILTGLESGAHVYFTHSYAAPVTADCVAETKHAHTFSAVVERGNVFGVQFHPEKSSDAGLRIIRNFLEVVRGC